jgi:Ca-activated chloride channel family protein
MRKAGSIRGVRLALALATALSCLDATFGQQPFEVTIVAPAQGVPLFGDVEVRAVVQPAATVVERLEVFVDGVRAGVLTKPPWAMVVQVGEENVEHRIEVVATARGGRTATAMVTSGMISAQESIDVALRPLFVRVERDGKPVDGLERETFRIFDTGVEQTLVTFERGDVPFTAVVLLDGSVSMSGDPMTHAIAGVSAFARAMGRMDETKLMLFADRVLFETPFTSSAPLLTLGLGEVEAGGGTALNDALYLALSRLEPRSGRKVVLVLSDGVDVESVVPMAEVRTLAQRGQVIVFWLRLGEANAATDALPSFSPWRDVDAHGREKRLFRELVHESGGRTLPVQRPDQVGAALATVLQELRDQYVLGYYPSDRRGSGTWHEVKVEVGDGEYEVRTHRGYLEP